MNTQETVHVDGNELPIVGGVRWDPIGARVGNRHPGARPGCENSRMRTKTFRPCDQHSLLLMPPSLPDWVDPAGLPAFVSDLVDELDLAPFLGAHDEPLVHPDASRRTGMRAAPRLVVPRAVGSAPW